MISEKEVRQSTLVTWAALMLVIFFSISVGPFIERFIPPINNFEIISDQQSDTGTEIYVSFEKVWCKFRGIHWNHPTTGQRVLIEFPPQDAVAPPNRPPGDHIAGPWNLVGVSELRGSRAYVHHSCLFLWDVYTRIYPPQER